MRGDSESTVERLVNPLRRLRNFCVAAGLICLRFRTGATLRAAVKSVAGWMGNRRASIDFDLMPHGSDGLFDGRLFFG